MKIIYSVFPILMSTLCLVACATAQQGDPKMKAATFLQEYEKDQSRLYTTMQLTSWKASTTGKKEDFEAKAHAEVAYKNYHSDPSRFKTIQELLQHKADLDPLSLRSLSVAELEFKENQLPPETIKNLVDRSAKIEQAFNTFRGDLNGKKYSNNELLDRLEKETDTEARKAIWSALKQVGAAVAPDLIALAKARNEAAHQLGYKNFWEMRIRLQEHDPVRIIALFDELARETEKPFLAMKRQLDSELAKRFKIKATDIQAWHYDNPFFQAAPPSDKVNLDDFYQDKKKEDVVVIAQKYFANLGLPIEDIVARSDIYEREGKDQHAFSTDIDRNGDVRTLQNVRATAESMDTMLHEMGHSVYAKYTDRSLRFNIRDSAHIFTTEGVAMLFGALASNPKWMITYASADPKKVEKAKRAIAEQRRREQLIFARWTLVMLNFEKAFYENPDQDLNTLWWNTVQRFQHVPHPQDRNAADWAAKPHFTIAPVYYHNYMMGELFAAQLRTKLNLVDGKKAENAAGAYLRERVFAPGMRLPWPAFVKEATGTELTARAFAKELK